MKRGEEDTWRRNNAPVERKLAHRDPVSELFGIGDAHGGEQCQRDRQVVMRAFLGQVGRRKVDRDPLGGQRQSHGRQRGLHALAALTDRLVGQADDGESGQAWRNLALDLDRTCFQSEIGNGPDQGDHAIPPMICGSCAKPRQASRGGVTLL